VFTIVVLAATASAAFAGGEGGALGKEPGAGQCCEGLQGPAGAVESRLPRDTQRQVVRGVYGRNRNGWNAYGKCVSSRNKGT
jgi:hypothetical protein